MNFAFSIVWFMNHDVIKIVVDNPIVLNLSLLFVFSFLSLITLKKTVGDQIFSILQTNQIRGLSIIGVIIGHLSVHTIEKPLDLAFFKTCGFIGVCLFLILSGFGLSLSIKKKGINNFFSRRITRVFLPYLFAMLLEVILIHLLLHKNSNIFRDLFHIFSNVSLVDRNMWYVAFILMWYCLTFLVFWLNLSKQLKIFFLCLIALGINLVPDISTAWKGNAFSFPLGCWLGLNYEYISPKIAKIVNQKNIVLVGTIIATFVLSVILSAVAPIL